MSHYACGCGHDHATLEAPAGTPSAAMSSDPGAPTTAGHGHGHAHEAAEGHDEGGCGCGHAHGEATDGVMLDGPAGGCGDGCACAQPEGALHPLEGAALRGFLSGVYASQLDGPELAKYLESLGGDASSEFGRPAQFLAQQLQAITEAGEVTDEEPAAWHLLRAVAGDDEDSDLDHDGDEDAAGSDDSSAPTGTGTKQ